MSDQALALLHNLAHPWLSPAEVRARIVALEVCSAAVVSEQPWRDGRATMPVKHEFTDGLYVRTVFIPKGLVVVGKIHRHAHLNYISVGDVTFVTEYDGLQRFQGPITMLSKAGTKRALYTHADTVWTTVHVTRETDLDKLEAEIIAPNYAALGLWDPVEAAPRLEGAACPG